ncbi:MAG TPA: UDP-4-amino-4,6-dideoxy-N-acetyl-beta-L-altrosamine transaminase [Patescibacteria group bacterium]|nr:UDP-4-amino-4,6-dideoxy-N-acetyl-beta-L-altrosamine transaminase [Patescibacteria group bacterium]
MIPYGRQDINAADIEAVIAVLKSDWLTQGPAIEQFEEYVAGYCGAKYAVAVCNATAALHIACLAAELGPGDVLWTVPNTFVASANCGRYCGATVDFVDIDDVSYNMSVSGLAEKLASGGVRPKIVIPVHFSGQSCEMEKLARLAKQYEFMIIEDASHAVGGEYQDKKIGACTYSDMTVFSFHPVKIVTTGEGGMVLTNRRDLYERLLMLRSHGITRNPELMQGDADGPWYYQQVTLGFNYRMTDLQAALGRSQCDRLDEFILRRRYLAKRYDELLSGLPLQLPKQDPAGKSAWHLYVIRLKLEQLAKTRLTVFNELRDAGINVNLHYIPVHTQPYYRALGFKPGHFPVAEKYYQEAITLPLYYGLTDKEQDYIVTTLQGVLK